MVVDRGVNHLRAIGNAKMPDDKNPETIPDKGQWDDGQNEHCAFPGRTEK